LSQSVQLEDANGDACSKEALFQFGQLAVRWMKVQELQQVEQLDEAEDVADDGHAEIDLNSRQVVVEGYDDDVSDAEHCKSEDGVELSGGKVIGMI